MGIGLIRGLLTALLLGLFIGLWFWAWSRNRDGDFEAAAQLPLAEDDRPPDHSETEPNHE
jgi:cbb3-type cytochrome oxidase subunit 3